MAFTDINWTCMSPALNQGQETITPFGGSPTLYNAPNVFVYGTSTDTVATIVAANYFLSKYASLSVGDIIWGNGSDASFAVTVTAVSSTSVTVVSMGLTTSIGTSNIVNGAVTYAKIQNVAAVSLLGNPTGAPAAPSEITLANGLEFSSTTLRLALTNLQYTTVAITAAQFNGMYAAPKLLVAAGGANTLLVLKQLQLVMTYVSANYAAGGVAAVQYDSTANGAGVIASTTLSAATFQAAASSTFTMNAGVVVLPFTTTVNKGLYLSNITGAFTTGDSTFVAHIWYTTIPTV